VTDDEGNVTSKPLSQDEMKQIDQLVKEAVGYNKDRGDTLNIVNSAFSETAALDIPETPMWRQPSVIATAKVVGKNLLIALVALYIFLFVLKPLLKYITLAPAAPVVPPEMQQQLAAMARQQASGGYQGTLQSAKQIAQQDPKMVANVVKGWIGD
jgi:flagellar M-ring protein FliF